MQTNLENEKSAKILVIDDSDDLLRLTQIALSRDGHAVTAVNGGREALSTLEADKSFQMILVDVNMPEMSGAEFLIELEKQIPNASQIFRILFLTAGDHPQNTIAHGFIRKGMDLDIFKATVRKHLSAHAPQIRNVSF